MKETLRVTNRMVKDGVIKQYAIGGAVAAIYYLEPFVSKKEKHRRSLAALPFERKIEIVFKLRERRKFMKSSRVVSKSQKPKTNGA